MTLSTVDQETPALRASLVRLVQTFASCNPLLDGHGNLGSVDDFPTGSEVLIGRRARYVSQGRGSIPMRCVVHIEEVQPGKGRHKRGAVVLTELPYQLSKAGWIEKLAQQVNEGKINGIDDIRDESDREGMRVVVELRRDANPETVLGELQRRTYLQSNYGAILLALVHAKPIQLTLIRRTRHALKRTEDRLEVVEGLITALNAFPKVIEMITASPDAASARASQPAGASRHQ